MKKLSLKKQFKEAKIYLRETKAYIAAILTIFIISIIAGYIFTNELEPIISEILKELIAKTLNLSATEMIFFIMQNNIQSTLIAIAGGGITLGIIPFLSTVFNGLVLGYVFNISQAAAGTSSWLMILPHGIFELPAVFISLALGIKLGFSIFHKDIIEEFKRRFYNSANVFLLVVIPLLILAAIIEGILISIAG